MIIAKQIQALDITDDEKIALQQRANRIARGDGHQRATDVVFGPHNATLSHTRSGYRKYTTGEYVPSSYRANFGWKNTYYQAAECVIQLGK